MKRMRFLFLAAMFLGMANVHAADVLTVDDVTLPRNGEVALEIKARLETNFTQFQLEIVLDEGLGLQQNKSNRPWGELGDTESTDHTVSSSTPAAHTFRYVISSMTQTRLPDSEVLLRVMLVPDGTPEVGTVLNGTVTNILLSERTASGTNVGHNFDDIPFTVTIGEPVDPRTLLDENATVAPTEATGVDVRVRRTINAGEWSTICLPFAMSASQCKTAFGEDVALGDFSSWSSEEDDEGAIVAINVGFTTVNEMEANHPYIIKVSEKVTEFTVDGVDIELEEEPMVQVGKRAAERGWMYGTYVVTKVPEENLFLSGNKFWYSTGKTTTKGLRGYFEFRDVLDAYYDATDAGSRITITFDDNTTTGISSMHNSQYIIRNDYYNLNGQRVRQPGKGLYIHNGKKVTK